jgi:uncharacterized membrane protein YhhN
MKDWFSFISLIVLVLFFVGITMLALFWPSVILGLSTPLKLMGLFIWLWVLVAGIFEIFVRQY